MRTSASCPLRELLRLPRNDRSVAKDVHVMADVTSHHHIEKRYNSFLEKKSPGEYPTY